MQKLILMSAILSFLISCNTKVEETTVEAEVEQIKVTENILNPYFIHTLFESPNKFGPIWNSDWTDSLDFKIVNIYEKGNFTKSYLESKFAYSFSKKGLPIRYLHYEYKLATSPISLSNFIYNSSSKLAQIEIYKEQGMENLPPVLVSSDSTKVTFVYFKSQDNDTTFVYPNLKEPKYIIEKSGMIIASIELFQDKTSDTLSYNDFLFSIDSSLVESPALEKILTYTSNSLPVSSYLLNEKGDKSQKIKVWNYSSENILTSFEAYLHGSLTDRIEFSYDKNNLPEKISNNRKKYLVHYEK